MFSSLSQHLLGESRGHVVFTLLMVLDLFPCTGLTGLKMSVSNYFYLCFSSIVSGYWHLCMHSNFEKVFVVLNRILFLLKTLKVINFSVKLCLGFNLPQW